MYQIPKDLLVYTSSPFLIENISCQNVTYTLQARMYHIHYKPEYISVSIKYVMCQNNSPAKKYHMPQYLLLQEHSRPEVFEQSCYLAAARVDRLQNQTLEEKEGRGVSVAYWACMIKCLAPFL